MPIFVLLHNWIISLNPNENALLVGVVGGTFTLVAAFIAVKTAFGQIFKQFEQKVIYEGWKDLQEQLFNFSTALMNYDSKIQWLTYFIESQDNQLVNNGNRFTYRQSKWQELVNAYSDLQKAYVAFLRSFENHEIIFLSLSKMKKSFIEEYRGRIDSYNQDFMEIVFPEMYGQENDQKPEDIKEEIKKYWFKMSEISAFLDDFRTELQNLTVGQILHKKLPRRVPEAGSKILTRKGFITQKNTFKEKMKKLKPNRKK